MMVRVLLGMALVWWALVPMAQGAGQYVEVSYPPSQEPGELIFGVTYTLWLPPGDQPIRGVIVHQHGCGSGACKGGATAAYDLHWQALAAKWNCALLGPSYGQEDGQNCRQWCDPRNGSGTRYLQALDDLAKKANRPEIATAPWCLWGHSGGGFWASIMQTLHPERIVAIWCRSGTAFSAWEKGEIPKPMVPEAAYGIPLMLNPGAKEKGDKRFNGAWTGSEAMFRAYRAKGAPVGFAPDPRTAHECGDSRYLAIPFFDACLKLRLPDSGNRLKPIDAKAGWLAPFLGDKAMAASEYSGEIQESVWLPDASAAKAWEEYVKTGAVGDTTPPPAPTQVRVMHQPNIGGNAITWDAQADFESGLRGFIILRNGKELAQLPGKPIGRFGRPLFQTMSYHDTPEKPLPVMSYVDKTAEPGTKYQYEVIAVNSVGLKSTPGTP